VFELRVNFEGRKLPGILSVAERPLCRSRPQGLRGVVLSLKTAGLRGMGQP
jgi:hypothetical protein